MYRRFREGPLPIRKAWKNWPKKVRLGKLQPSAAWKMRPIRIRAKSAPARCRKTMFPKSISTRIDSQPASSLSNGLGDRSQKAQKDSRGTKLAGKNILVLFVSRFVRFVCL